MEARFPKIEARGDLGLAMVAGVAADAVEVCADKGVDWAPFVSSFPFMASASSSDSYSRTIPSWKYSFLGLLVTALLTMVFSFVRFLREVVFARGVTEALLASGVP